MARDRGPRLELGEITRVKSSNGPLFETDCKGNVRLNQVTGWAATSVADVAVLLQLRFVKSEVELKSGKRRSFQFAVNPLGALELPDLLIKNARRPLDQSLLLKSR